MQNADNSLTKTTAIAGAWVAAGKLLARSLDFITLLILARMLTPADFGLVAMAMAVVQIAEVVTSLPLVQALLRSKKITKSMCDTAFTLSILRGVFLSFFLIALSWPLSYFFEEPRVAPLICTLALAPAFRGAISPNMVVFMQKMDFRRELVLDVSGKFVALCIASAIALLFRTYWAIAAATLATPITMNAISYILAPYRPKLSLADWPSFANLVGWNSVSQVATALNWQIDRIALARFVEPATLGRYTIAQDISNMPLHALVIPLARPLSAAFALNTDRNEDTARNYCIIVNAVLFSCAPILIILSFLSGPIIETLLGPDWIDAAKYMKLLAIISIFAIPAGPTQAIAMIRNRSELIALRSTIELLIKLPLAVVAVWLLNAWGAILATAIGSIISCIISFIIIKQLTGATIFNQIRYFLRTIISLLIMALFLIAVNDLAEYPFDYSLYRIIIIILISTSALILYVVSSIVLWVFNGKPPGLEHLFIMKIQPFIPLPKFVHVPEQNVDS